MEKETVKILFVGNASAVASEISLEIHRFFNDKKVPLEIEHVFTGSEVFKKIEENIFDFDIVVFDKKLKTTDVFLKIFIPKGHPFILLFFDSSKNGGEEKSDFFGEYLNIINKRFFEKEDLWQQFL